MPNDLLRISQITPRTPIAIETQDSSLTMSPEDVLKWLAPPGCPLKEAIRLLLTCRNNHINPWEGEAYLVLYGERWQIVHDKAGWLHRAEQHPHYDGFEAGIVVRKLGKGGPEGAEIDIAGTYLPDGHVVSGGWARVHRKDRKIPTFARISHHEYVQATPPWKRITCTMLQKVALIQALRHSGVVFKYAGYDRDEMPVPAGLPSPPDPGPIDEVIEAEFRASPMPSLSLDLGVELRGLIDTLKVDAQIVRGWLEKRGVANLVDLTDHQAREIISKLRAKVDQQDPGRILEPTAPPVPGVLVDGEIVEPPPQASAEAAGHTAQEIGYIVDSGIRDASDEVAATIGLDAASADAVRPAGPAIAAPDRIGEAARKADESPDDPGYDINEMFRPEEAREPKKSGNSKKQAGVATS